MNRTVEVLPTVDAIVQRALEIVLDTCRQAIAERDQFTIALAGGSTPKPLYEAIASQSLPWEKLHIFWGDERYVPADHPDSNEGMARRAWLDRVAIPATNIYPVPTTVDDPAIAADQYEQTLRTFFHASAPDFPAFDLILLGIGDDGHTASLFPQTEALAVRDRLITVGNKAGQPRITFTAPLINQARSVVFMVAGANKRSALAQIFAETADDSTYPARLVRPQGRVWWLLDRAAGEGLL